MAIVSLRNQQITIYDAERAVLRSRVSSGQKGRETPAGIFSIIEKQAEHYSNLYDDALMPHMQRITWSGIALHGGIVPRYPASHGCIRMPYDFAERLFGLTRLGMRVIVAPGEVAPVAIAHPALFPPRSDAGAVAAARAAESEAAQKADQARLAAVAAFQEVAHAWVPLRIAENLKFRAEEQLAAAERAVASKDSAETREQAEDAKAKTAARVAELDAQLTAAKAELQPKLKTLSAAREATVAAQAARMLAAEAARQKARDSEPVSAFISRKTQRLYVRQAFAPVLDIPVAIRDADRPIGTYVFTAMARTADDAGMQWSVVSLVDGQSGNGMNEPLGAARRSLNTGSDRIPSDPADAKAALDRIAIPRDTFDRIAAMVSPRSSLIISDEALSSETGNGTEFVVLLSGEPQGGLKNRRHRPDFEVRYERPGGRSRSWRSPFVNPFFSWW